MDVRLVGLDPGFGAVKVAEVQGEEVRVHSLPSVVGVGTVDAGGLSLAGVVRGRRLSETPQVVGFQGVEYLVGHNVHEFARPMERMDMARFSEGPELRALLYAALYQLLDGGGHTLALAVGLPVEVLQDEGEAREAERGLSGWLTGKHRFTVDGTEARFEVTRVRARIAQPVATWFDWGLGLDGQWTRGAAAAKAPAVVVDQGFNTLDLLVVEGGRISTRYTSGDRLGMRRAAEMTATNIQRRHGVELSLHEADGLVRLAVAGKKAHTYVVGQRTDITNLVRQAVNGLSGEVIRFVERSVGSGRKFQVLLTGGGALALAPALLRAYPHAELVPDAALANARGLAKLARRPGFLV